MDTGIPALGREGARIEYVFMRCRHKADNTQGWEWIACRIYSGNSDKLRNEMI